MLVVSPEFAITAIAARRQLWSRGFRYKGHVSSSMTRKATRARSADFRK
jgi:hypothetical protein